MLYPTLSRWIAAHLPPPTWIPDQVVPGRVPMRLPSAVLGVPLRGNYIFGVIFLFQAVLTILGEEAFWRGYVLPGLEVRYGNWAWVILGAQGTLFHLFFYWEVPAIAPAAFASCFVASMLRSTTPGLVVHAAIDFLPRLPLLLAAVGVLKPGPVRAR
jgi:membrane protease YdiL (CAAX protease family)